MTTRGDDEILFNTDIDIGHALTLSDIGVHTVGDLKRYNAITAADKHVLPARMQASTLVFGERMLENPMGKTTFVSATEEDANPFSSSDEASDLGDNNTLGFQDLMPNSSIGIPVMQALTYDLEFPFSVDTPIDSETNVEMGVFVNASPRQRTLVTESGSATTVREIAFAVTTEWLNAHGKQDVAALPLFTDGAASHGMITEPCYIERLNRTGTLQLTNHTGEDGSTPVLVDFDTRMLRKKKGSKRTKQRGYTYVDMGSGLTFVQIEPDLDDVVQVNIGVLKMGDRDAIIYQSTWFDDIATETAEHASGFEDEEAPVYGFTAPFAEMPEIPFENDTTVPLDFIPVVLSEQYEAQKFFAPNDIWARYVVPGTNTLATSAGVRFVMQPAIFFHSDKKVSESVDDTVVMDLMGGTVQVTYARAATQQHKGPFKLWSAQFESPTIQSPNSGMLWWIHNYDAVMATESDDPYGDLANTIGDAHIKVVHYTDM